MTREPMRIVDERPLRGPNLYDTRPVWRLDLRVSPGLATHPMLKERLDVDRGNPGRLVGSTAVALQQAAGIAGDGHHAEPGPDGHWTVVFGYEEERSGQEAGRQAVQLVQTPRDSPLDVEAAIEEVRAAHAADAPEPSVQAILEAARQRGIPVMRRTAIHHQLGWGIRQEPLWHAVPGRLSSLGHDIAEDLERSLEVLQDSGIPLAGGAHCSTVEDGRHLVARIGLPVVVRPPGGKARTVATLDGLTHLLARVEADDDEVFVQEHVAGGLHRALVVAHDVVGAVRLSDGADVTDTLHPSIHAACRRAARYAGLDVAAVDVVATDLSRPMAEAGRVVALQPTPPLEPFLERGAAQRIIEYLFPEGDGRIPLVAVTGTNGKTTTVRLIAHLLKYAGARVGMAVTGALEVENEVILRGDWSGPAAAQTVLREPGITHAVCEVARGGILRSGLGFDACDVGVLLNVAGDHLGQGGIDTIEEMTRLKSVVLRATREDGTIVLNADDPNVWALRTSIARPVIPFTMDPKNPDVQAHLDEDPDHLAVTVHDGAIVVRGHGTESRGPDVADIPITLEGAARFNVQNVLGATATACAVGLDEQTIWSGLLTFNPSMSQSPGRMNLLHFGGVKVLIDYGHNVAALNALAPVLARLATGRKINVACAAGNRRDEDLREFGATLAGMYDRIYLTDADPRGREPGETPRLVAEGLRAAGFDETRIEIERDEPTAQRRALAESRPGDLVVLQPDDIDAALRFCRDLQTRTEAGADGPARLRRVLEED